MLDCSLYFVCEVRVKMWNISGYKFVVCIY